jgi:hypothetical protein
LSRYQGIAVKNYGGTLECLANERIRRVKNPEQLILHWKNIYGSIIA